ncbi:MAG: retention module-containing protein [Gammaproteobacteria bacterium]|nr:retention module-containing protein [Gammaproteobacteria bacterium]
MAVEIGIIKTLIGTTVAIATDGTQRNLQVGDRVFADEIISTGATGAVEIEFSDGSVMNLGRSSQTLLDNDVFDIQQAIQTQEDAQNEADALQQALLDGVDPTQVGEATAASAGAETTGNEGTDVIQVDYEGESVTPTSGFDTEGVSSTSSVSTIEEEGNRGREIDNASEITVGAGDSDTGAVTEDVDTDADNAGVQLISTGSLTVTDVDTSDTAEFTGAVYKAGQAAATGSLSITAGGDWTYTGDNAAVQYLDVNETKVEVFTVTATDGTTHDITITIYGAEDPSDITVGAGDSDTGAVTEDVDTNSMRYCQNVALRPFLLI